MTVSPYAVAYVVTILVSWSADHFNARALHSAVAATIGACAFMASALLPATSYEVRNPPSVSPLPFSDLSISNVMAA